MAEQKQSCKAIRKTIAGAAKGTSKQHGQHISEIFSSIQFPKPRCSRNRTLFGQFRVLKERLRQHNTNALTTRSPIMAWMMRHCAYLTNNYLLHSDGQTSYFRRWQRNNTPPICEFCETALYMVPTPKNQPKAEPRFFNGIWLGRDATASESFIRTAGEVVRARTIFARSPVQHGVAEFNTLFNFFCTSDFNFCCVRTKEIFF